MKTSLIIISVVVLIVVGWLLISKTGQHQNMNTGNNTTTQTQTDSSPKSDKAPDFHLQDYNDKTVSLTDFTGKPVVINSWAAWCPFCQKELVDFAAAQKEFEDQVVIVAIDRAESREVAKKYSDELGVTGDLIFLLDPSDSFYQSIGGFSMPETIFVAKNGAIMDHKRGPMEIDEIRDRIRKIMQ